MAHFPHRCMGTRDVALQTLSCRLLLSWFAWQLLLTFTTLALSA